MNCPTELTFSIYADGELTGSAAEEVKSHLRGCENCQATFAALEVENQMLVSILGERETEPPAQPKTQQSATPRVSWGWVAAAVAAMTPVMLHLVASSLPQLPTGLGWLKNIGPREGVAIAESLMNVLVGANEMLSLVISSGATLAVALTILGLSALHQRDFQRTGTGIVLVLLTVMGTPRVVDAAEVRTDDGGVALVGSTETINDSVFLSGDIVRVEGTVKGDVFAFADEVRIVGTVIGNVYGAAETFKVSGKVTGNVHIVGGKLEIRAPVGGSVYAVGERVVIDETCVLSGGGALLGGTVKVLGVVERSLFLAADQIHIDGNVRSSITAHAGHLTVGPQGTIEGDLEVTIPSKELIDVREGRVLGTKKVNIKEKRGDEYLRASFYWGILARTLALLVLGFLVVTLFPSLVPVEPRSKGEVLRHIGIGFVAVCVTPFAMLIAAITVIGLPVSLLLAMTYLVLTYLSSLVLALLVGKRLQRNATNYATWGTAVSLLAIMLITQLPLIGFGLNVLVHLFGTGSLIVHLNARYRTEHRAG